MEKELLIYRYFHVKKFGVDHKMGHYTGDRILSITNTRNNRAYFSLLKLHHKVADVMIKPKSSNKPIRII
jgi:hypothetical protein